MAKILLIDDDNNVVDVVKLTLEDAGNEVLVLPSGANWRTVANAEDIDLLITDIYMPDVDGLEVVRQASEHMPDLPILAISGGSSLVGLDGLHMAKLLGADATLDKPFRPHALLSEVGHLLSSMSRT